MAIQPGKGKVQDGAEEAVSFSAFFSQLMAMASALWTSKQRTKIFFHAALLVVIVGATAFMQVRLNNWNKPFYNALSHKEFAVFTEQLGVFGVIAGILLALNVAQAWLTQSAQVVLREGLVEDLIEQWLKPGRAFRMTSAGAIGDNPDQRIQQDAENLTNLTTVLGVGLLQSTLLLLSFVGVLWVSSSGMTLTIFGRAYSPPGYMVWCALLYSILASALSWMVGRPLINLTSTYYAREAEFRHAIVVVNDGIESIAFHRGEADEKRRVNAVFDKVLTTARGLVWATTRLTWVTAGTGWIAIVAPILVAAPTYFTSEMSFGDLMLIVGGFNQVQSALGWFVNNFSSIATWRATLLRVAIFRQKILSMDDLGAGASRIDFVKGEDKSVGLHDLRIDAPEQRVRLSEPDVRLAPGERALIVADTSEDKSLLFRAIGGLWPWGSGKIEGPGPDHVMFLPPRAHVPPGDLAAAVAYPLAADAFAPEDVLRALAAVGLEHLEQLAKTEERWDRALSEEERQRLAFARVLLRKPSWIVINDALDAFEPIWRRRIVDLLKHDLAEVGVINIGHEHDAAPENLFTRTVRAEADPDKPRPVAETTVKETSGAGSAAGSMKKV